jgi:hypothetical protein
MRDYTITLPSMLWNQIASQIRTSDHRAIQNLIEIINTCNKLDDPRSKNFTANPHLTLGHNGPELVEDNE